MVLNYIVVGCPWSTIRYGFHAGAKAIRYSMNTYPTCDTPQLRSVTEIAPKSPLKQNPYPLWFSCRRKTYLDSCEHSLKLVLRAKIGRKKKDIGEHQTDDWSDLKKSVVHCGLKFLRLLYRPDNSNYVNWLFSWADSSYKQIKQTERFYSSSKEISHQILWSNLWTSQNQATDQTAYEKVTVNLSGLGRLLTLLQRTVCMSSYSSEYERIFYERQRKSQTMSRAGKNNAQD